MTDPPTRLAGLADAYWQATLGFEPLFATQIGERSFDALVPGRSPEAVDRHAERLTALRRDLATVDPAELAGPEAVTWSALAEQIDGDLAALAARLHEWTVDPLAGPQVEIMDVESFQAVRSVAEGRDLVERWRAMGAWLDETSASRCRAIGSGRVAVASPIRRVIDEIDGILAARPEESALLAPARVDHPDWPEGEVDRFREDVELAVRDLVLPALARYRDALAREVLPAARPDVRPGICHIDGGEAAYADLIRVHTSLPLSADELHATGLAEVDRIRDELAALGERTLGTAGVPEIQGRLRSDPALHFGTSDEVLDAAVRALARANEAIPAWFGILPRAVCEVVVMGAHEEAHSTIAYYRQPPEDGSRPGQYYVNTGAPETRPRYEAEALAYHESVPGHHLQIAIGQELGGLPAFRRNLGPTSFVEGWGLYTERLADEMGLYSSDLDRIGVLSYDGWRACRLVVDTGMHAFGWTRQRAIDYMVENTVLAENNVANEVDRYITWPGQALAYKVGQLEILRLRERARTALGERFDPRAFHDAVLGAGAIPLEVLRDRVMSWVTSAGTET
jgi:uncharacterized protein (DUF885 family)